MGGKGTQGINQSRTPPRESRFTHEHKSHLGVLLERKASESHWAPVCARLWHTELCLSNEAQNPPGVGILWKKLILKQKGHCARQGKGYLALSIGNPDWRGRRSILGRWLLDPLISKVSVWLPERLETILTTPWFHFSQAGEQWPTEPNQ